MLNSLRLYSKYFLLSAFSTDRKHLLNDYRRFVLNPEVFMQNYDYSGKDREEALSKAIRWLLKAQQVNADGGMGSYHLINKWSSSYPETTGYIIPTLINFGKKYDHPGSVDAAIRAADFLLRIQKSSGGWQGGRVNENKPEIVFNTGQIIRGMIAVYEQTGQNKYIDAGIKAGNWLTEIQHPEGYWKTYALMNLPRVYDTFVDAPLLDLYRITGDERFKKAAVKNLDWVIDEKMIENGWFNDCDNTVKRNEKPILHTIAYTLDGLIDSGLALEDEKYIHAAKLGALFLRDTFNTDGFINGRFDRNWKGSEYMICTGCAQMAIIWLKLFRITEDENYLTAGEKMIDLLIYIQTGKIKEDDNTLGAIPGSFPLWGRYEPFAFPNWATKFFCDALILEQEVKK